MRSNRFFLLSLLFISITLLHTSVNANTVVSITPSPVVSPAVGERLAVNLRIADGNNVAGYQATVQFDATALRYVGSASGDYLPFGTFFVPPREGMVQRNSVTLRSIALTGESQGDGILATLTFEVLTAKASTLTLTNVILSNRKGKKDVLLPSNLKAGSVTSSDLDVVRLIYFVPKDSKPHPGASETLNEMIERIQVLYAEQMQSYGFDKTFTFDAQKYTIYGKNEEDYYLKDTLDKVTKEIPEDPKFDVSRNVLLVAIELSGSSPEVNEACAVATRDWHGDAWWKFWQKWINTGPGTAGGWALIPTYGNCNFPDDLYWTTAHELGHAFGLAHDFQNRQYIMSYGARPNQLSKCAAEWCDASRFFNTNQSFSNSQTTRIKKISENPLRFELEDADGLHQAQLLIPTVANDPTSKGFKLHSCGALLNGASTAIAKFNISNANPDKVRLQVIDMNGNITRHVFCLDFFCIPIAPSQIISQETSLLPNYPNPFNPETWMPYQLAESADVNLSIYSMDGKLVRTLTLGHQAAGIYQSKSRAAHWDGRNKLGERVASGLYFYTFTAGDFTATRKMLIRK